MVRRALVLVVLGGMAVVSAQAPAFEVASVKPNTSASGSQSGRASKGSVVLVNMTLRGIIANAYRLRSTTVTGGPDWIDSERFDINARAPENTPDNQLNLMLRSLLAERFRLAARLETREQPVYALVLARDDGRLGPNLHPSGDCAKGAPFAEALRALGSQQPVSQYPCGLRMSANEAGATIQGGAQPIAILARTLDGTDDRHVVDRTGLTGTFSFELRFAGLPEGTNSADRNLPNIFTALQEQLGLKLESTRGPVEVLVIDSVERPTPD